MEYTTGEVWKQIDGFEKYEVSTKGRVRRLYQKGYKHRKPVVQDGYTSVTFHKSGSFKKLAIHRIVAQAFLPNPENKPEVNHKDGDPMNNSVYNLEWCTRSENEKHAYRKLGKKTNGYLVRKLTEKQVVLIREEYKRGAATQKELAEKYKVGQATISRLIARKTYSEVGP